MATIYEQVVGHIQAYDLPVTVPPASSEGSSEPFRNYLDELRHTAGATRIGHVMQRWSHSDTNKTPAWIWHFAQSDAPLEIIEFRYSPGLGIGRQEFHRPDCIPPAPAFHPASVGDTSFWNLKITKPGENYSFQNAWGKAFVDKNIFCAQPDPPVADWMDLKKGPLAHFRHFLQRRPLSRGLTLYMPMWDMIMCSRRIEAYEMAQEADEGEADLLFAGHRAVVLEPIATFSEYTERFDDAYLPGWAEHAFNCDDLLMWDQAAQYNFPPAGQVPREKQFWRIPFAHTRQQLVESVPNAPDWKTGFHGTNLYSLYAILYHGRLMPSLETEGVAGDRGSFPGVYLFSTEYDRYKKVLTYAPWVCLEWKGVAYQCCLELKYHNAYKENVSGDQVVCASENIVLVALWIRACERSDFVPGQDWICLSLGEKLWDPLMEGNPLDPSAKIATRFNFRTQKFDTGLSAAVSSAGMSGAASSSAVAPSAGKTQGKRKVAPDAHDHEAQMAELSQLNPMHVQESCLQYFQGLNPEFKERWDAWFLRALDKIFVLHDHQYENTVKAMLSTLGDPVSTFFACVKQAGDRFFAAELGDALTSLVEPITRRNDMHEGLLSVISDSTLGFKKKTNQSHLNQTSGGICIQGVRKILQVVGQ